MTDICTICDGAFDLEREGGAEGYIGMLPVQFCPTCKAGIMDFADQARLPFECPECGYFYFEEGGDEGHETSAGVPDDAGPGLPDGADRLAGALSALIADNICTYDPRSANFIQLDGEDPRPPRTNCACDNCFYGRDVLAMALLAGCKSFTGGQ